MYIGEEKIPGQSCIKYSCGCNGCDLPMLLTKGCPKLHNGNSFPYLDTAALNELERKSLLNNLKIDKKKIIDELISLRFIFVQWIEDNVPLDELKYIISTIVGTATTTSVSGIMKATGSHKDLTEVIWNYVTWFDCSLLKDIVDRSCERLKMSKENMFSKQFQLYEDKRAEYCKRKIFECPNLLTSEQNVGSIPFDCFYLVVGDGEKCMSSMTDIECFVEQLRDIFNIKNHNLILRSIAEGSLELMFLISPCVREKIFPLSKRHLERLAKLGVTDMSTGDKYESINTLLKEVQDFPSDADVCKDNKGSTIHTSCRSCVAIFIK